ncbi:peptidase [Sparassis latifolia]|uniref:Peptide hydrolase n=1 Tax=Sparassis crispa TaxID=139825 RepID=A0A401H5A1_9APHY|nr:Leucine aminopeptidase 1 [Sparassis crispa]GBE89559.1 Leucine aminopeptidase 1 [Sparassis crispa]
MKTLALLSFVTLSVASVLFNGDAQVPLGGLPLSYPGFDLDLNELRWVQLEGHEPVLITELDKINLKAQGVRFFDVTETPDLGFSAHLRLANQLTFSEPQYAEKVNPILKTLSTNHLEETLRKFSSFRTRYYRSETGRESQQWLLSKISEITADYAPGYLQDLISIKEFTHSWIQKSIIVRINGSSPTDDGVVIVGAHLDSTNMWPFLPAPGADDDGSGSMSILEAYRGLLTANFTPTRSVEFQWYSAEEGGLLGSQAIAQDYERRSVNVTAMSHYDMTAWVKRGTREEVGILTDFTTPALTEFQKKLVDTYLDIPYVETQCGYACSDHASFLKAGYPVVCSFESAFENSNQNIHSTNDRIDISDEFSFTHMLEFSKLAVAFAVEQGGWSE